MHLESVMSAMLCKIPQAFSLRFCILQAIKTWRRRRPGNEASIHPHTIEGTLRTRWLCVAQIAILYITIIVTKTKNSHTQVQHTFSFSSYISNGCATFQDIPVQQLLVRYAGALLLVSKSWSWVLLLLKHTDKITARVSLPSLVPRPAREMIWLHKSKSWAHFRIWKHPMRLQSGVY